MRSDRSEDKALIDLRRVEFVDAYAMVALACLIARWGTEGSVSVLGPPKDPATYLARMRFQEFLDQQQVEVDERLPTVRSHDHTGFLVELTQFSDTYAGERLASVVYQRLASNVESGVVQGMHEATSELGANVDEHAASPVGGFMAAQTYRRHQHDESLLITVGDAGLGLATTLSRTLGQLSDAQAVEKALERDVTGTDDPGRGQGLADLVEFTQTYGGTVVVHSGSARCAVVGTRARTTTVSHFPGTLIGARVPCRPRPEGGFR